MRRRGFRERGLCLEHGGVVSSFSTTESILVFLNFAGFLFAPE
jgi:hypothetical protein